MTASGCDNYDGPEKPHGLSQEDWGRISEWNRALPDPVPSCVHDLIEQQRHVRPQAPAVHGWDGDLSYGELADLSDRLGRHLVKLGVCKEVFVPLHFEKSIWAVVSMLAVLKAGAACVFLEPSHPTKRKRIIVQKLKACLLLTSSRTCPEEGITTSVLQIDKSFIESIESDLLPVLPEVCPNDAAVCLFTSGSTGKPKGIVQEHRTAAFSAQNCARIFGISTDSRVFQWAAYCFDMSVIDMLMTLGAGACLCVPSEKDRMDRLASSIVSMRVNIAAITPSVAKILKAVQMRDLQTLIFGGEAVSREHLEGWPQALRIINAYGPAEGSESFRQDVCVAGVAKKESPANIGRAAGSVVWIVDDTDPSLLAPVGETGEIYLEGPLLARGYLHDPVKTASAFAEDLPWLSMFRGGKSRPNRLYKTGDLARYNNDGTIQILGRIDTQVKLRGQRIEVEEIEHHIRQLHHRKIAVAVDLIHLADTPDTAALVAFIAPDQATITMEGMLEELLATDNTLGHTPSHLLRNSNDRLIESLPPYMIPSYIIPLRCIPLTLSGKVDRARLKELGSNMTARELSSFPHRTTPEETTASSNDCDNIQRRMALLWAKVIPVKPGTIKADDHFFRLGGDSIHAMQVASLARDYDLHLTTRQIFKHPTLSAMSTVAQENALGGGKTVKDLDVASGSVLAEVSRLEHEIEAAQYAPDIQAFMVICGLLKTHGYINFFSFDLDGPIDAVRLEYSCRALLRYHSSLRTTFRIQSGRVLQEILRTYDSDCEIVHIASDEDTQILLANLCEMEKSCASNLGDLLVRFILVQRRATRHTLIMRISHAQFDGTSLHLIYRDLKMIYEGGTVAPTPHYVDFAHAAEQANGSEAEEFWKTLLRSSSMTHIVHHSEPSYKHIINMRVSRVIPYISIQGHGITLATLIKASWAVVLARLSRTQDVVFGYAVTGRNLPLDGIDQIVGDCNNAALVRVRLDEASTVLQLLHQIQEQSVAAMPYETVGQRQIVEKCTDWPRWTRYSSSVNHQNYTMAGASSFKLGQAQCTVTYKDLEADRRDIQIYSYLPRDDQMKLEMAFSNRALSISMVELILKELGDTVQRFAADVQSPLQFSRTSMSDKLPLIPLTAMESSGKTDPYQPRVQLLGFRFSFIDPRLIVEKVWKKLVDCFHEAGILGTKPSTTTPFYSIGGDLVYAAQLSIYYREERVTFAIEDLIENPTQEMQVELLSSASKPDQ